MPYVLQAAIMGIRQAKNISYKSIVVNTDSMFLINSKYMYISAGSMRYCMDTVLKF